MIASITSIWDDIMTWVVDSLGSVQSVFYNGTTLTFLGTLSVITVAIGISLLLINIVKDFLHFRG